MSLVFQAFGHKPKFWTNLNFDLMAVPVEKPENDQNIANHPEGGHKGVYHIS